MAGHGAKQSKRKSKRNPSLFKKVFSFKQQQGPKSRQPSDASSAAEAPNNNKKYAKASNAVGYVAPLSKAPSSDDETSTCSFTVDADGVLVFLTAHRLTKSSPPPATLERIPGLRHRETTRQKSDTFLSLGRRRSSSSSALPLAITRSPYESRKAQKNLSATLKSCRHESDGKCSLSSAWERRYPKFTSTKGGTEFSKSKERQRVIGARNAEIDIVRPASSNSSYLPVEVSPAYRFIPIGCEEDYDDDDSDENDICKEEDVGQSAATATIIVNKPLSPSPFSISCMAQKGCNALNGIDHSPQTASKCLKTGVTRMPCAGNDNTLSNVVSGRDRIIDKYSHQFVESGESGSVSIVSIGICSSSDESAGVPRDEGGNQPLDQHDPPPSPVPTDCASRESNDSIRGSPVKQKSESRCFTDKFCLPLERPEDDWFPNIKHEILKLSSFFNCEAYHSDTFTS